MQALLLKTLLREYLKQFQDAAEDVKSNFSDRIQYETVRRWKPYPQGPAIALTSPTEDTPEAMWYWDKTEMPMGELVKLYEIIEKFESFVLELDGLVNSGPGNETNH